MTILVIKTDQERAYLGIVRDYEPLGHRSWDAHRELSATLLRTFEELCEEANVSADGIEGVVCYEGPGSFTGLRIGLGFGNALAYSKGIPIVSARDSSWIEKGVDRLLHGENDSVVLPFYGAEANITKPKK
jgi:tRNA threonylcarbamoyladenosine biosynthesis protein TsaB